MIPADVNIDDLARQLAEDGVAIGEIGDVYPSMEGELQDVLQQAAGSEFGRAGIAILDDTPARSADQRDIAQDLLNAVDLDTVIVRSPGSGAIVSDIHSRADIETAQWRFLADSDYVTATRNLAEQVTATDTNWVAVTALMLAAVAVAVVVTALSVRRSTTVPT